jgi:hypothetical protein
VELFCNRDEYCTRRRSSWGGARRSIEPIY